ncbi:VrrA/YqfQ family protein [Solibacillus sp. CAU 1738]|uniref:VrrA/YqfQ family protein n=1 Tax=Solibacillus sp. CAU 1738 TaxID=3140363 RepID=UPI0032603B23
MRPFSYYPAQYQMNPYNMMPGGFSPFMRAPGFMQRMPMPRAMPGMPGMHGMSGMSGMPGISGIPGMSGAVSGAIPGAAPVPKLDSILQTANSFMNNAQKFTPYVQQAAPMFKNLPALWRMYRGFSNSSSDESSTIPTKRESRNIRDSSNFDERSESDNIRGRKKTEKRVDLTPKPSVPRIYQPPFDIF